MTGRYRLVESIGQGGMGRVWRAADEMLDRQVAVKEMRIDGLDAEDTRTRRERTLREARATARIDHPNVVRVYDVVDEGERLWIVMELVNGRSLERMTVEDGPLGPRETALLGLGLVQALRQVHARGVLHRDIKPGNVLVESADRAGHRIVLTDFGIAAMQDAKALTMVGMLVGSPDYMAPERVSGRPQGPPSDIWSLGATLCAALGGRSPFSRDTTLATLHAVLYEEPELPAAAGPLTDILAALLEKDPSIRPALDDVESALHTVAFPTPTPTLRIGAGDDIGTAEPGERRGSSLDAGEADEQGPAEGRRREEGAGAARGPVAGEEGDREHRLGNPGRVDPERAAGPGRDGGAGAALGPVAGEEEEGERRQGDPGRVDSVRAPGERQGDSARASAVGRADPVQTAGPGRDEGAQTSEAAPVAARDPRVPEPEPETGPEAAVREPAMVEPSDAVPPGFAPSGGAGDEGSGAPSNGFPALAEVVAAEPEPPTPAEPFSTDRVASASSEAASEERSEVRSETPSGSAVGAVLRAGATTASTPLASAPTQDSLSAGAPTEHFPMPDAPTRDTPTRAASAPTRVGPGVSLVRGKQAVPDQHAHPGPTSGSGATGTPAGTGTSRIDGPAANLRTDPSSTDGQDPGPALVLGPHPHRMPPGEPPGPA
ncbi:serine/threonine protein kinase, partial [Streptomyces sp. 12257]|uniref:serine/threonine-protein kinase n=1 Tax=Streptomyces sp. 12257 TaxID=3041009 RepID=UPI0024A8015B